MNRPAMRFVVLVAVGKLGRATVKEVTAYTGLKRLTVGARLTELYKAGFLDKTNERREGCRVLAIAGIGDSCD